MFNVKNMLVQNRSCDKIKERGLITVHPLSWYRQTPYSRIQAKSPRHRREPSTLHFLGTS